VSWIKRRPLLALGALALSLRVAAAVVTEYNPIFPAYYYTDARLFHEAAVSALREEAQGRPPVFTGTLNTRVQASLVYELYRWTGPRPLAIKLVNAALGAAGVVVLTWVFGLAFSRRAALAAGLLVAIWPTHVFYTSQNLKEAPADFLAYAGLACALAAGRPSCARRDAFAALAVLAMVGAGFYRPQVLEALSAALLVALSLTALRDRRVHALAALGAVAASLALCAWTSRLAGADADYQLTSLSSPSGITDFRKAHQSDDRRKALALSNREIATQIFPDVEFRTWGGVASYLPKGAFYVLFMPLPGLYPMAGKIGRLAAAGENTVLLLVAALAVLGIIRGPKTPIRLGLLVFFAVMTAGAALLEFDLGSAGRHKLLYLPMLFPFAAEEALRLLGCPQETPS
jgi:4-amino-4-deoxy-L-arabinose transferase-like glycosyltransferase